MQNRLQRQSDRKAGTASRGRVRNDFTMVECNDFLHHGKPQTVSFGGMRGISLIELVEDMCLGFQIHTGTMIDNGDDDIRFFCTE